jgi:hypothetical protein
MTNVALASAQQCRSKYKVGLFSMVLLASLGLVVLAGCGPQTNAAQGPSSRPPTGDQLITFTKITSYAQALREITDQGMQPGFLCSSVQVGMPPHTTLYTALWQPQGQRDRYARTHQLYVYFSETTGDINFLTGLSHLANVVSIRTVGNVEQGLPTPPGSSTNGDFFCPTAVGTPPAGTPRIMYGSDGWFTTKVTFTAPLDTYDAALYVISNLGLALDANCFYHEQTFAPVGQEKAFATTHTLMVQTANHFTSIAWLQQLRSTPGVASVAPPSEPPGC